VIILYTGSPLIGSARCPVDQRDNTIHIVTPEKLIQFVCQALRTGTELCFSKTRITQYHATNRSY